MAFPLATPHLQSSQNLNLDTQISHSTFQYQNVRWTTRLRGGLISLVHQHAIQTRAADTGEITAIALMGTDVERIVHGMGMLHETWSALLDIAVASWLLGLQLSLACLAPIILVSGQWRSHTSSLCSHDTRPPADCDLKQSSLV